MGAGARPRRARQDRGRKLGVGRRRLPGPRLPALPDFAVARRRRCQGGARIRCHRQGLRSRRLHAAGSEVRRGMDRRRPDLRRHRLRPGLDDGLRLPAHRQALEARHAAGASEHRVRGRSAGRRGGCERRPHTRLRARRVRARARFLQPAPLSCHTQRQSIARHPQRRVVEFLAQRGRAERHLADRAAQRLAHRRAHLRARLAAGLGCTRLPHRHARL